MCMYIRHIMWGGGTGARTAFGHRRCRRHEALGEEGTHTKTTRSPNRLCKALAKADQTKPQKTRQDPKIQDRTHKYLTRPTHIKQE